VFHGGGNTIAEAIEDALASLRSAFGITNLAYEALNYVRERGTEEPSKIGVSLAEQTRKILETLTPREREVLDARLSKRGTVGAGPNTRHGFTDPNGTFGAQPFEHQLDGPEGSCTDECVATHPDHADTRGDDLAVHPWEASSGPSVRVVTLEPGCARCGNHPAHPIHKVTP
jgi:hypothetical protein